MRSANLIRMAAISVLPALLASQAIGAVAIYAGPGFAGGTNGAGGVTNQSSQQSPGTTVVSGMSIGRGSQAYPVAGGNPANDNTASFVITPSGATVLTSIGTRPSGNPNTATVYAISGTGMLAGTIANSTFSVQTATRWTNASTPTALLPLTTNSVSGASAANGYTINNAGVVAGSSTFYGDATTGLSPGSASLGSRPVFWAAGSVTPTPLGVYGFGSGFGGNFTANGSVQKINAAGTMVGGLERYTPTADGSGSSLGTRATLWAAGGGAPTELPNLGTTSTGSASSFARVINDSGVVGGYSAKYVGGVSVGQRPIRWTSTTTFDELAVSGTNATGGTNGNVIGINGNGDVVGNLDKYDNSNVSLGTVPMLWKAGGTALTPLGLLGTDATGTSFGVANNINDSGFSVGTVQDYVLSGGLSVAALWDFSGAVTNLNTLIPTVSSGGAAAGWVTLTQAYGITNDGWISGIGTYNPGGGLPTYTRSFLMQNTAVPEPTVAVLGLACFAALRTRRPRD